MTVSVGEVYRHHRFYWDGREECWKPKYLLVLCVDRSGDIVFRLLTSKTTGRQTTPRCSLGDPYPSFYVGILGTSLDSETWVDLRGIEDYEGHDFAENQANGQIEFTTAIDMANLCEILECVASALDTNKRQEQLLRDQRAELGCG